MEHAARNKPNRLWAVLAFALVLCTATLFFCSKSSPAYPLNDWPDANVFLSAGHAMLEGKVLYRDLYDHKGPLLYYLHALCAMVSADSFLGVWFLEILTNALFLWIAYRLIALYADKRLALAALPLLAVMLFTSISFQMGDSAEELALPMILYPLYGLMRSLRQKEERVSPMQLAVTGFLLGCVFWLKFTLVGLSAGVCLMLAWLGLRREGIAGALKDIGWMLLGFLLSTLPWILIFWAQGALLPFLKTYLYDNLFLYAGSQVPLSFLSQLKAIVKSILSWLWDNPGYTLPMVAGAVWLLLSRRFTLTEKISACLCAFLGLITVFFGGRYYLYYGFAFAVMVPVCLLPLCAWLSDRLFPGGAVKPGHRALFTKFPKACIAVITVLCIALCPVLSPNMADFGKNRDELMQYRFAKIIQQKENPTLLNYGFLDWGFYTAAGVAPHLRFYHLANMPLEELHAEQDRYVQEGMSDFVVTRKPLRDDQSALYTLVDTCPAPRGLWFSEVYLYQLTSLE